MNKALPLLLLIPLGLGPLAISGAAGAAEAAPVERRWWQELRSDSLAELGCAEADDLLNTLSAPWQVRKGSFKVRRTIDTKAPQSAALLDSLMDNDARKSPLESGRQGDSHLEAVEDLELCAGDSAWRDYAVCAEVMLGKDGEITLAAADALDGERGRRGQMVAVKGSADDKTLIYMRSSTLRDGEPVAGKQEWKDAPWTPFWLRPDLKRMAATADSLFPMSAMSMEEQKRRYEVLVRTESTLDQYWDSRWLHLRIEVTARQARMWVEGVLVGSVDFPARNRGGVALLLNEKDQVRALTVHKIPAGIDGYLPLDLAGRFNNNGLNDGDLGDGSALPASALPLPGQYITVGNIPFYWNCSPGKPNNLDMTQATIRGAGRFFFFDATGGDRKRIMLRVPRRQYNELAVLVAADRRSSATNEITVRMVKAFRCNYLDAVGRVPGWNASSNTGSAVCLPAGALFAKGEISETAGRLWLVRIPLDPGAFQDFLGDDNEKFLDLDLMDMNGKGGVHVFAATLVPSPVELKVVSDEVGHVFVQPQAPAFKCILRNFTPGVQTGTIDIAATDYYGKTNAYRSAYSVPAGATVTNVIAMQDEVRGVHYLDARLRDASGTVLVRRQTTYALLPPDTRQADLDSPFGMWSFGAGHYGGGTNAGAILMNKIGVRWSHHADAGRKLHRGYLNVLGGVGCEEAWAEEQAINSDVGHWSVFAETAVSERHYDYFPLELLENPRPMELTPAEEVSFQGLWEAAITCSELARKYYPDKPLVFGNGYPQFIWTFLSRGYPRKYLDGLALDFMGNGVYMFYYLREVAKHYGYGDIPLFITEGFYAGSDIGYYPGRASEDLQLNIYLRGFLVGFSLGMEKYIGSCLIWDNGGGYYYTGYGPIGVCHRAPELNPKPAYCAYGTMSLLLDKARFHSFVPVGSLGVYLLRFDGPRGPVYAAWTADGSRRAIRFAAEAGKVPRQTDSQCNSFPLESRDGRFALDLSPTPVWIENAGVIREASAGNPVYDEAPATNAVLLYSAADPAGWAADTNAYAAMQALDFNRPVKAGAFRCSAVDGRMPGERALALTLIDEPEVSPYRLRYSILRPKREVVVKAGTSKLGAWVYGNGTAALDLEVRDAKGVTWHTIPGPRGYGFGMGYDGEPHAFEGWRFIEFPFEGGWVRWRNAAGGGKMAFPLTLTGLIVEQYGKVLYVNRLMPAYDKTWRIGDVLCE